MRDGTRTVGAHSCAPATLRITVDPRPSRFCPKLRAHSRAPLRGCEEIGLSDIAGVTCHCIFFVEWEIHVQVTALDRPLPPGEGRGEGLPATSVSSISSHPIRMTVDPHVTCQRIFFVEWEIHVQVAPLDRPLPPGEGWGEGLPATYDKSISSHPLRITVDPRPSRFHRELRAHSRAPLRAKIIAPRFKASVLVNRPHVSPRWEGVWR